MADMSKFKRRGSLGTPPPVTEASANLEAPEIAPPSPPSAADALPSPAPTSRGGAGEREHDGRSARRTGRTVQFATRVSQEFDKRLRTIARRDGLLLVEVLERGLDAYELHPASRK